ncbi:MAG: hypothetical protein ACKN9V_05150 [Pseudomonadota bacterium]
MRFLLAVLGFTLITSLAQAGTRKDSVEEFLHVTFEGEEAVNVYRSLDLPVGQLSEGKGKNFRTRDGSVDLSCFNRHYNANEPYACHFIFDFRGLSKEVTLKSELKGMRFILNNPKTSKELYDALLVPVAVVQGKLLKILEVDSGEVVIDCRLDANRTNANPQCSVLTTL